MNDMHGPSEGYHAAHTNLATRGFTRGAKELLGLAASGVFWARRQARRLDLLESSAE